MKRRALGSEAAAAKVAELRSMVGERYRDLLAAADSIVRMRTAADNLVDRLESAEDSLSHAGATSDGEPFLPSFLLGGWRSQLPKRTCRYPVPPDSPR